MSNENGNGNQRNGHVNGSASGHQNDNGNHHIPANGVSKNGNGSNNGNGHQPAEAIPAHDLLWDSLPASVTDKLGPSPWTPAWSPSARVGATGASPTLRAAPPSTRPIASSASAAGATSWWAT